MPSGPLLVSHPSWERRKRICFVHANSQHSWRLWAPLYLLIPQRNRTKQHSMREDGASFFKMTWWWEQQHCGWQKHGRALAHKLQRGMGEYVRIHAIKTFIFRLLIIWLIYLLNGCKHERERKAEACRSSKLICLTFMATFAYPV